MAKAKSKKAVAKAPVKAKVEPTPVVETIESLEQEQPKEKAPVTVGYDGYKPSAVVPEGLKSNDTAPETWEYKDRTYVLCTRKTPIMMTLPVRHTAKRPLLWYDEEKGYEREIRYATNQKSVFVDEQEGHVTLEHVAIRNGSLFVPKNKQALQKLLSLYHPLNDVIFKEVDERKDAVDQLDIMDMELEALNAASAMDIDMAEAILRVEIGNRVNGLTTKELKRDLRLFAKRDPILFMELANDENVAVRNMGIKAVERGILALAADQRTFTWKSTGRKIMTVPFDENPYSALAAFFKTDDGVEIYMNIEKRLG
jgi:hypothetical protein